MPVLPPRDGFLHMQDPFVPQLAITYQFQALLTTFSGLLFSFRSRYYFAIGFKVYLALEVDDPLIHARIPTRITRDTTWACLLLRTGLSPSVVCRSRQLPLHIQVRTVGYDTTSPLRDSVCALSCSLAVTNDISVDFSSSP